MLDPAIWNAIKDLSVGALATFALIGGFRGWYVWRREHEAALARRDKEIEELRVDRDYWRSSTLRAIGHTESALEVARAGVRDA